MESRPPLSYRWLRANGVNNLVPWHFLDGDEGRSLNAQFHREDPNGGHVWTFARRQDCDDCDGFVVLEGQIIDRVIRYHPSFQSGGFNPYMIRESYLNLWAFLREAVISDTADWCSEEDLLDLTSPDA